MILLPVVLGISWFLAVVLAPLDGRRRVIGAVAVAGLAVNFVAALWLAGVVWMTGPVVMVTGGWPEGVGITLRADALGGLFSVLATGLLLISLAYEVLGGVQERTFPALVLFLAAGLNGLFLTGDIFNFYVFFEVSMTASFVLASYGYEKHEVRNALIFMVVNLIGSVLFLSAVAFLYHVTGTLNMSGVATWVNTVEPTSVILIATLIFVAFSLKLGLFPFHFWLPSVYRDVRPIVAAILSGVLANIGSYGLLRFGADVLPRVLQFGAPVLIALGIMSSLYGALFAVSRRTGSEMLAYSSISQVGYLMIALGIGGSVGLAAAVLYAVVNALNKTMLFLTVDLQGKLVGAAFLIGALSVAGIPPSAGFFGKVALFQVGLTHDASLVLITFLFLGSALSFVYTFQIYQQDFWAGTMGEGDGSPFGRRMLVLALAGGIVLLGLWPEPLLAVSRVAAGVLQGVQL